MKKESYHLITGTIHCLSGVRIGGSDELLQIGGTDLSCIKHPVTLKPYIPGSSIKGKMRSELEKKFGFGFEKNGKIDESKPTNGNNLVSRIFGAHMDTNGKFGPTRIIVRDATLLGEGPTELKTENIIDRKSGSAKHPRKIERVSSGSKFSLKIGLQVFDIDKEEEHDGKKSGEAFVAFVMDGLHEIQNTGLGSGVSRGSGEVEFLDIKVDGNPYRF